MVGKNMFGDQGELENEVDEVFRSAGYIRPTGANYLVPSTSRRFPHSTFCLGERRINMSNYVS